MSKNVCVVAGNTDQMLELVLDWWQHWGLKLTFCGEVRTLAIPTEHI